MHFCSENKMRRFRRFLAPFDGFLNRTNDFFMAVGRVSHLSFQFFYYLFRYRPRLRDLSAQLFFIGNKSLGIVLLTAVFTGMVLALQFSVSLARFGLKIYAGSVVGIAIARELGPVLSSLMLAARAGSGMTAELGSMAVTEQIMAMEAMGSNPIRRLVVPRVLASLIAAPLLTVIADLVGVLGGMMITMMEADVSARYYIDQTLHSVEFVDFSHGIAKTIFFGFAIGIIACYEGLNTKGGTEGVGLSTTRAVVTSSILILIIDFFLTKLFILL